MKMLFVGFTLIAAAGLAAAQSSAPAQSSSPAASPERKPTPGQSGLNLKLDNAARFSDSTAPAADALPSLGADARTLGKDTARTSGSAPAARPYPIDSERDR